MSHPTAAAAPELGVIAGATVRGVSVDDLVRWTAAVGDFSPIHYDAEQAAARGFAGPVVNGPWKSALVMQILQDWAGTRGRVESLECRYQHADIVGGSLEIGAQVTRSHRDGPDVVVDCEVWVEDGAGERTLTGSARVRLHPTPSVDQQGLPLAWLRDVLRVGEVSGVNTYRVGPDDIADFRAAVSGTNRDASGDVPAADEVAPPTFYAAVDPVERGDLDLERAVLDSIPFPTTAGGNAFNEIVYDRPIKTGDVVTVMTTYSDVYLRQGRSGTLLFRVRTNELVAADGEHIATTRMGHVLAFDVRGKR